MSRNAQLAPTEEAALAIASGGFYYPAEVLDMLAGTDDPDGALERLIEWDLLHEAPVCGGILRPTTEGFIRLLGRQQQRLSARRERPHASCY